MSKGVSVVKNKYLYTAKSTRALLLLILYVQLSLVSANQLIQDYGSNHRWALDLSTRYINKSHGIGSSWKHVIGLDFHKVFQNDKGDFGTLLLQPYWVKLTNVRMPPFNFDDGDDWELTWRMTNFNYTGLNHGKFNIRVGHFEVPFGLEQNLDTNGTVRQFTFSDRGIKADWGVSVNGVLETLEYELALSRGSGMDYETRDDPYLFAGRLGTSSNNNLVLGLSGFFGEILNANGTSNIKRIGLDVEYYIYQWQLLSEISGGLTDDKETINIFTEASWRTPLESLHLYSQLRQKFQNDIHYSDSTTVNLGAKYSINTDVSLSSEIVHQLDTMSGASETTSFIVQFRIRI